MTTAKETVAMYRRLCMGVDRILAYTVGRCLRERKTVSFEDAFGILPAEALEQRDQNYRQALRDSQQNGGRKE